MFGGYSMDSFKNNPGACALIFSDGEANESALMVSTPPPLWLSDENLSEIRITEEGMYCLYFLFFAPPGFCAYLCINDRKIRGSSTETENGTICGGAVCSIHTAAIPCTLSICCEPKKCSGIFLVVKCSV